MGELSKKLKAERKKYKSMWGCTTSYNKSDFESTNQLMIDSFNKLKEIRPSVELVGITKAYFVFDQPVLYFSDSELPDWEFGIWGYVPYKDQKDPKIVYYGEHRLLVDKFKPSRTYISEDSIDGFINKLTDIKNRESANYFASSYYGHNPEETFEELKEDYPDITLEDFYKKCDDCYNHAIQLEKDTIEVTESMREEVIKTYTERLLHDIPYLSGVGLYDCNKGGWSCSPQYEFIISVDIRKFKKLIGHDLHTVDRIVRKDVKRKCNEYKEELMTHYDNDKYWQIKHDLFPTWVQRVFTSWTHVLKYSSYYCICRNEGYGDYYTFYKLYNKENDKSC